MSYLYLRCTECNEEVEVYCDGDNAMICPECISVDCFEDIEEEEIMNERRGIVAAKGDL